VGRAGAAVGRPEPPRPASTQHVSGHNQNLTGWGTGAAAQDAGAALERVVRRWKLAFGVPPFQ